MNEKRMCANRGTLFCLLVAVAALALADSTWQGAFDNDVANPRNWSDGLPTSGQANILSETRPLALSSDVTMTWVNFDKQTGSAGNSFVLDLGADRTWTSTDRTFVWENASVTLKSGTFNQSVGRFFVGDNRSGATFTVDGPAARLVGANATGGNGYISVGSANGTDSRNNLLKVMNGGYLGGWLILGRLANGDTRSFCGTNTVWITGTGSRLETNAGVATDVGCQQGLSRLVVDEGASAVVKGDLRLGVRYLDVNRNLAGAQNAVVVSGTNSTMELQGNAVVGFASCSNVLEVADGASLTVAGGLYTSQEYNEQLTNKMLPFGNVVRATGAGTDVLLGNEMKIGRAVGSRGDALEVLNGARVRFGNTAKEYNVGANMNSCGNRVLVDGGTLDIGSCLFFLGRNGDGNVLTVTNGGVVASQQFLYVGDGSSSNVFEVASGGTVNIDSQFRLGWYNRTDGTKPGGNALWIHGPDARFVTTQDFRYDRFDGQIGNRLLVEDGGLFECRAYFQSPYTQQAGGFSSNLLIHVTGDGSRFVVTNGEFVIGYNSLAGTTNVNALVQVDDGGEMLVYNNNCIIGNGNVDATAPTVCERNRLLVGPGGRFRQVMTIQGQIFRVGSNFNARDNVVTVEGDFRCVNTQAVSIVGFSIGYNGASNRFEVVNGGRAVVENAGFIVGYAQSATDCSVLVGADSELCVTNAEALLVGNGGPRAGLTVEGGRFETLGVQRVVVGGLLSGTDAWMKVRNGAVANMTRLVLGDKSPNCRVEVDDATLNIVNHDSMNAAGYLEIGYSVVSAEANPANAVLCVKGRNAKIRADGNVRMRNPTARIEFVVPAEGFAETPLRCHGFETVAAGASLHVSADPGWPMESRATLVEADSEGQLANLALSCDEGLCVRRQGTRIVVTKPGCLTVILR